MDKASPLKQLVNFTSYTIGLEKTLRLIQALAQVAGELGTDEVLSAKCLIARDQLALGRSKSLERSPRYKLTEYCRAKVFSSVGLLWLF